MKRGLLIIIVFASLIGRSQVQLGYETVTDSIRVVDFSLVKTERIEKGTNYVLPNIVFDFDSYRIQVKSYAVLNQFALFLSLHENLVVEISNHRDCRGSDKYSSSLTQRRAQSVVDYLVSQGVEKERLVPKGYGDSKPLILNGKELTCGYIRQFNMDKPKLEKLHQLNRRTEFNILSFDY